MRRFLGQLVVESFRWFVNRRSVLMLLSGLGLAWITSTVLYETPEFEISYAAHITPAGCGDGTCSYLAVLEIGNTGQHCLEHVRVLLRTAVLAHAVMPPRFARFGKIAVQPEETESATAKAYALPKLCPTQRIDTSVVLRVPGTTPPSWEQLLESISASPASVVQQPPEMTRFLRFWYGLVS